MAFRQYAVSVLLLLLCAASTSAAHRVLLGQPCWSVHIESHHATALGVYGTFGGCVRGTKVDWGCNPDVRVPGGSGTNGVFDSLSACCDEVHARTRVNPMNGQPMPNQANAKSVCLTYKPRPSANKQPAQQQQQQQKAGDGSSRKYLIFKTFDLQPSVDVSSSTASYSKVCGGKEAVACACNAHDGCNAFTFGAEGDCGYLKRQYHSSSEPSDPLLFKKEGRGWDVYVSERIVPKSKGGALDCGALKHTAHEPMQKEVCAIKQALPQVSGSLSA